MRSHPATQDANNILPKALYRSFKVAGYHSLARDNDYPINRGLFMPTEKNNQEENRIEDHSSRPPDFDVKLKGKSYERPSFRDHENLRACQVMWQFETPKLKLKTRQEY